MTQIPLVSLLTTLDADERPLLAALDRVEAARKKALDTGNDSGLQKELEQLGKVATEAVRRIEPLEKTARAVAKEFRDLDTAVKSGLMSLTEAAKRYSALENTLKGQLATLSKSASGYGELERQMKTAGSEAQRLEAAQKGAAASYKTDDIKRYALALRDIEVAQRSGLVSQRDAQAQLKSLQGAMSQYAGSLKDGSAEQRALQKVMADTGTAANKLQAAQDKLKSAFRSDYLKLYSGELRQIDAAVKSGVSGFGDAARQIERVTTELRSQQSQLGTTGREYDQLSRLLQGAATQQERYQKAAQSAAKANDTAEIKRYGTELKQLEATLQDTARQYGQLDSAQRAIRYDATGVRNYRTESEQLTRTQQESLGAFSRVGAELATLKARLTEAAASAGTGSQKYADLERLLQGVEKATVGATQAQERSQQAYRAAELSQFVARLREVEAAQKGGVITAEQAARAISALQGEFKSYTASLAGVGRELGQLTGAQRDAATGATGLASAQERAAKSFDSAALRSFAGELEKTVRAYREGESSTEQYGRAVSDVQGRLREYGSTLDRTGAEFTELNRLLTLSERALVGVGTAAERSSRGFDPAPITRYGRELQGLETAQRDLVRGLELLERAQRSSQDAFARTQLDKFRGELDALSRALKSGSGDFELLARAATTTQRGLQDYLGTLDKSAAGHGDLNRVLELSGNALRDLETSAQRAGQGFDPAPIERFAAELERLDSAQKDLGNGLTDLSQASDRLSQSFDGSRLVDFRSEIERLIQSQRDGRATFDETGRAVQDVQTRFKDYVATLNLTAREQETLNRALDGVDTALTNVGRAAETASRGFDAAPIRDYTGELGRIEGATQGLTGGLSQVEGELSQLGGAFRDSGAAARTSAGDHDVFGRSTRELDGSLAGIEQELSQLTGSFRETGQEAGQTAVDTGKLGTSMRELGGSLGDVAGDFERTGTAVKGLGQVSGVTATDLGRLADVERQLETATVQMAAAQDRVQASFKSDTLRTFRGDLEQIVTANRNGVASFEQTARAVDALQGRMRDFGGSVSLSVREQGELARVMGATETAVTKLTTAQQRAGDAFQAEQVRQQVAALNDLKLALERGDISQEQFAVSARGIGTALEQSRSGLDNSTRAYDKYTTGLTRVESSLAQAEGRVRTFGVASGVSAGLSDTLGNIFYSLGIAGEGMAVAMGTAATGMAGAATSARLLNVALAAGLVGAVIGVALGIGSVVKQAFVLNTGLTDVAKTTGFTGTQLNGLAKELQNIALNTGTPVAELTDLAAIAGSMGVTGVKNIAQFTDTINLEC